jgi:hypothetical protein
MLETLPATLAFRDLEDRPVTLPEFQAGRPLVLIFLRHLA